MRQSAERLRWSYFKDLEILRNIIARKHVLRRLADGLASGEVTQVEKPTLPLGGCMKGLRSLFKRDFVSYDWETGMERSEPKYLAYQTDFEICSFVEGHLALDEIT
jgi:hypothetical protein